MMQTRSASSSASSICCVLMIIERPNLRVLIRSQICWRDSTSSPEVGSSKMMVFVYPMRAIPRDNLRFIPPEHSLTSLFLCSVS